MTWADLCTTALKRINIVQAGETPSSDDLTDAFARLKLMLGSWRNENLTVPYRLRTTATITSTKGVIGNPYTVGVGGDVNVVRPPMPNEITVRYQNTAFTPTLELSLQPLTDDAWEAIPQKNLTSPLPTSYYYQPTYSGGLGSLYLWLVPTQSLLQLVVYTPAVVSDPVAMADAIVLPDGYEKAITDNLAVYLFPEWRENVPMDPGLAKEALESKRAIKVTNTRLMDLSVDPALTAHPGGRYSIYSDTNV